MLPRSKSTERTERYRILCGMCPDESCKTKLYFPSYDSSIECSNCGQRHPRSAMVNVEEVTDPEVALHNMIRNLLVGNFVPKKTTDSVKVLGLSNYHCKLLSPLLTYYGMDKQDRARPLREVNQKDVFDCSVLGSRAFLIQPEHIGIMGYGRDQTGSAKYLSETLQMIYNFHDGQEVLIPIHADGDGHCLVHGISRALVGRELFWHALRTNLKAHFLENLERYKNLFCDFVDAKEWDIIIAESDPEYLPGPNEAFGLQNIHIFGLANVLHRPIILLDSLSGLQSSGDYTGVFLPGLVPPEQCRGKDGKLNKPLCVAWSSSGRNHFIALVGVKGRPLPRLPHWMLTKAWGMPHELIKSYIEFDEDNMCIVGGDRALQDKYIQRLATAMEAVFLDKSGVHPSVVADVHQYIYKRTGVVGVQMDIVIENTRRAVQDHQLYRCLMCNAVSQLEPQSVATERLRPGGDLYQLAKDIYKKLDPTKIYSMPAEDITCTYDPVNDVLVATPKPQSALCAWCQGKQLRLVRYDGTVLYHNGDRTSTPAPKTRCNCGYKHYWDGKEYDNHPAVFPVKMTWKGESVTEEVVWFQNETDQSLNSNAFDIASSLLQKHFPGEFGSEKLVQQVVDTILQNTAKVEETYEPISLKNMPNPTPSSTDSGRSSTSSASKPISYKEKALKDDTNQAIAGKKANFLTKEKALSPPGLGQSASKIILTGHASKTLHKEELTMSQAERDLRQRIEHKAPVRQRQKSAEEAVKLQKSSTQAQQLVKQASVPKIVAVPSVKTDADKMEMLEKQEKKTAPVKAKKIRLTTSDGRQATISLDSSVTFCELQNKIESELQIPAIQQRIRCGFPPKELRRPEDGKENEPLPLHNGEKVMVEVLPDPNKAEESPMDMGRSFVKSSSMEAGMSSSAQSVIDDVAVAGDIMRNIERLQQGSNTTDELDMQLNALPLLATLTGVDLWRYAQRKPHLFERGGLYYRIVERDLGLVDGKHCTLPNLTNKKFYYNGQKDHLELCLEPLGHFPITDGIDDPQKLSEIAAELSSSSQRSEEAIGQRSLSAGGSGVIKHGQKKDKYVAFGGQAHKLLTDTGEKERDVRPKVRRENQRLQSSDDLEDASMPSELGPKSDSRVTFDSRQSHFNSGDHAGEERDNTMETDAVTVSRLDVQSGPSSPMEVEQSKGFPPISADVAPSSQTTSPTEQHLTANYISAELSARLHGHSDARSTVQEESSSATASSSFTTTSPSPSSTNTESVYVTKKLGPGYTVLMKQPAADGDKSDGEGGET